MSYTTSPNMGLIIPTVGSEAGPLYASDINNSLTLVDAHKHSPGMGVQIQPSGLNINGPLTFQTNPITNLGYAAFTLQTTAPSVVQSLYVLNGSESTPRPDLWYYDGSTAIQITSSGTVNASIASLPGESYSAGTFTWKQGSGSTTPANFDLGSLIVRPTIAATTYGTLIAPATGLAGTNTFTLPSVNMTMPTGLPLSLGVLTMDTSGNVVANPPDNVTITFNSGKLEVPTGGITSTQIASNTITSSNIASGVLPIQHTQTLTGSGSWTVPANVNAVVVTGIGGGGGGGGSASGVQPSAGGGGGGAGMATYVLPTTPGASLSYSVGTGGAGGGINSNGSTGGTTTFSTLSWFGASGGATGVGNSGGGNGGAGGGGDYLNAALGGSGGIGGPSNVSGSNGQGTSGRVGGSGSGAAGGNGGAGGGGSSQLGTGGAGGSPYGPTQGYNGTGFGAGGGGGVNGSGTGGNGSPGTIILAWAAP